MNIFFQKSAFSKKKIIYYEKLYFYQNRGFFHPPIRCEREREKINFFPRSSAVVLSNKIFKNLSSSVLRFLSEYFENLFRKKIFSKFFQKNLKFFFNFPKLAKTPAKNFDKKLSLVYLEKIEK